MAELIELLAPAGNVDIARQAILHGADAVYIGAYSHGARKSASNSIEDISRLCAFAHVYGAKVYVTVNCIVYENELKEVEQMCRKLYYAGVDALIVQDMALLRLNLPDIPLHASTQCDTRTVEKARFLEQVGFSQIVLARELTLSEIKEICASVSVPVECFIHGALCVSYSGRCHASMACLGRSANRGECAQICRLPMKMKGADGKIIIKDKHLLSLKDLNQSERIGEMLDAGVRSFKIEGRLKDVGYVKNVTAHYRKIIDKEITARSGGVKRSSFGISEIGFNSNLEKSFNRGFTHYFLDNRLNGNISSIDTPKSLGEKIYSVNDLNNGDGISFFNLDGQYTGVLVNGVKNGKIIPNRSGIRIPDISKIRRTSDVAWLSTLEKETAKRRIRIRVTLDETGLTASDERGVFVRLSFSFPSQEAKTPQNRIEVFEKLGNTDYILEAFIDKIPESVFIPNSRLSVLKKEMIRALDSAWKSIRPIEHRRKENLDYEYPIKSVDFRENVANSLSKQFYSDHKTEVKEFALELTKNVTSDKPVMTTRHCILRSAGMCLKQCKNDKAVKLPVYLETASDRFKVIFNCSKCEMQLFKIDTPQT